MPGVGSAAPHSRRSLPSRLIAEAPRGTAEAPTALYRADAVTGRATLVGPIAACGSGNVALTADGTGALFLGDFEGTLCALDPGTTPPTVAAGVTMSGGLALAGDLRGRRRDDVRNGLHARDPDHDPGQRARDPGHHLRRHDRARLRDRVPQALRPGLRRPPRPRLHRRRLWPRRLDRSDERRRDALCDLHRRRRRRAELRGRRRESEGDALSLRGTAGDPAPPAPLPGPSWPPPPCRTPPPAPSSPRQG